jgi:hypothetical protein
MLARNADMLTRNADLLTRTCGKQGMKDASAFSGFTSEGIDFNHDEDSVTETDRANMTR